MERELSAIRLYAMRFVYVGTAVFVGLSAWPAVLRQGRLIRADQPWDLMHGIAFSLYAAYAVLMLVGARFPVRMLPLLLFQILYKSIWLIGVAYPLWSASRLNPAALGTIRLFAVVVVLDLVVIPWRYVFAKYVRPMFTLDRRPVKPASVLPGRQGAGGVVA